MIPKNNIGDLNRRISFEQWDAAQDPGGGPIAVLKNTYPIWAKVEPRSGVSLTNQQQYTWNYDYKITFRYEKSRVSQSNFTIKYDNKRLAIQSLSFVEEGNRKYVIARCSTTDVTVEDYTDVQLNISVYTYFGLGDEFSFIKDGTATSPPNFARDIRNRTVLAAYKDGIRFDVILTGTPDVNFKQVLYTPSTGQFLWSIPFEPEEVAQIDYI